MNDFQRKCADSDADLEETYVMGHRLKAFLGQALPKHPHYRRSTVAQMRSKSLRHLAWIKDKMHELAMKIDEEQLNTYITNDFDPEPDDLSTSSSEQALEEEDDDESGFADFASMGSVNDQEWHAFSGWGTSSPDFSEAAPLCTSTESDSSLSQGNGSSLDESDVEDEQPSDEIDSSLDLDTEEELVEAEPQAFVTFQDDDECSLEGKSEFLRRLEEEDVAYEDDSEAQDSWAQEQDSDSHAHSCASSGLTSTADPARIAFREILMNAPKTKLLYGNTTNNTPKPSLPTPQPTVQASPRNLLTLKSKLDSPRMARYRSIKKAAAASKRSS